MALVSCAECGNQVSDRASACPRCGNPIFSATEIAATGTPITTTQTTSKRFKAHQLIAALVICVGVVVTMSGEGFGSVLLLIGLVWLLSARFRAWWHHA